MATHLKVQRIRRDLTAHGLAEAVGLTQQTISALENGVQSTSRENARKVARSLGLTFDVLFEIRPSGRFRAAPIIWAREDVVE